MFSFAVDLGFSLEPCGIFVVALPAGLLCREALRSMVGSREQFLQARCPIILRKLCWHGLIFRTPLLSWHGIRLGATRRRPGFSGVDGGLALAGNGAFDGLETGVELAPPSGDRLRFVAGARLRLWIGLGLPASAEFSLGFSRCFPDVVGVGEPVLVAGVVGFEPLAFGGQLRGEGLRRWPQLVVVVLGLGVGGLPQCVGFGLGGEPQLGW